MKRSVKAFWVRQNQQLHRSLPLSPLQPSIREASLFLTASPTSPRTPTSSCPNGGRHVTRSGHSVRVWNEAIYQNLYDMTIYMNTIIWVCIGTWLHLLLTSGVDFYNPARKKKKVFSFFFSCRKKGAHLLKNRDIYKIYLLYTINKSYRSLSFLHVLRQLS